MGIIGICPFEDFYAYVPEVYPEWICGGEKHKIRIMDEPGCDCRPKVELSCTGDGKTVEKYLILLENRGFNRRNEVWVKMVDGREYTADIIRNISENSIIVSYYCK